MTMRRRWLTSCALAVFFAAVTGYLFWIPYDPAALYRAIPADAVLVSRHRNLGQRWPGLSTNIWLSSFFDAEETSVPTPVPNKCRLVSRLIRLARQDTVFAYLPAAGAAGKPAWMAASWIGGWSPCVRWALFWGRWPEIKELGTFGGRTMWGLQTPPANGRRLSFTCGDGVLLACLSSDPSAIRYALMAYDGLIPSTRLRQNALWLATGMNGETTRRSSPQQNEAGLASPLELQAIPEPVFPDVVWGQWQGPANAEQFTLTGEFGRFDDQGLSATIRMRPSPFLQARLADSMDVAAMEQFLGNLPVLVVALPLPTLQDGLRLIMTPGEGTGPTTTEPAWLQTIRLILQSDWIQQASGGLMLALFTGEYGGGYGRPPLRMSVPALMAFTRVRQPEGIQRIISRELDLLNARHRLGLIRDPIPLTVGPQAIWTLEITGNKLRTALEPEDRPAYTLVGDLLIVSSQAGSLAKLMQRFQKLGNETPPMPADWHIAMSASNTAGLAWLDLNTGGKTVQLALTLWGLNQRTADTPSMPQAVKTARTLLDNIRPLQSCALWMEPEGSNVVVRIEIGPRAKISGGQ